MMNVRSRTPPPVAIHDILSNSRRRAVVASPKLKQATHEVRELACDIAERGSDTSPPPGNGRKSVNNSLLQTHLPKLDREDVVEYDDRNTVTVSEAARDLNVDMELVTPDGTPWSKYSRLLAVLSLLGVVATHVGAPGLTGLDPLVVPVVALVVIALSTGYQRWDCPSFYLKALFRGNDR